MTCDVRHVTYDMPCDRAQITVHVTVTCGVTGRSRHNTMHGTVCVFSRSDTTSCENVLFVHLFLSTRHVRLKISSVFPSHCIDNFSNWNEFDV